MGKRAKKSKQAKRLDALQNKLVAVLRDPEFIGKVSIAEIVGLLTCIAMDVNAGEGAIPEYSI